MVTLFFLKDICALDGVHNRLDGKEYIIELNNSAIGLNSCYEDEDLLHIRDLVLLRMFPPLGPLLSPFTDLNGHKKAFPLAAEDEFEAKEPSHSLEALKEKITKLQMQLDQVVSPAWCHKWNTPIHSLIFVQTLNEKNALQAELEKAKQQKGKEKSMFGLGRKKEKNWDVLVARHLYSLASLWNTFGLDSNNVRQDRLGMSSSKLFVSVVGQGKVDFWSQGDDAQRVDARMTSKIVLLDVYKANSLDIGRVSEPGKIGQRKQKMLN